jgi:hypothetical protein
VLGPAHLPHGSREGTEGARGGAARVLWITTNFGTTGAETSGGLYRLTRRGRLVTVADDPGWLDYPTTPVFSHGPHTAGKLYVANGAYNTSYMYLTPPAVVAVNAGVPAAPCR